MWYAKIQYLLNEQEVLDTSTNSVERLIDGDTEQDRHNFETYKNLIKRDHYVGFPMLSSTQSIELASLTSILQRKKCVMHSSPLLSAPLRQDYAIADAF